MQFIKNSIGDVSKLARAIGISAIVMPIALTSVTASGQSLLLEEVVVTAQKREQSKQDVGIAITSFSGEQLDKLGVDNSTDIAAFTPGVSLSGSFAGQQRQFSIRGVTQNDFNDHVESPTAIYIDDGYVASQQGQIFASFDLERVEILKGPQGTLFGRNATGGLVHYVTRKPTQESEGYFDLTIGEYSQTKVEAAFGGSLSDTAAYRVAGLYNKNDGYLDNKFPEETFVPAGLSPGLSNGLPAPEGTGADLGGDETWALRGQVAIELTDTASMDLSASFSESTQSTGPYQSTPTIAQLDANGNTINTFRIPEGSTEIREFIHPTNASFDNFFDGDGDGLRPVPGADFYGYRDPDGSDFTTSSDFAFDDSNTTETAALTAKLTVDLGNVTLTSVTDYKTLEKAHVLDLEASPASQFTWFGEAETDSFTQEFRLSGSSEKNNWVTGLYYLTIDTTAASALSALPNGVSFAPAFVNFEQPRLADLETTSVSIFAQNEFSLSDSLKFILGGRVTKEEKQYEGDVTFVSVNNDPIRFEPSSLNAPSGRAEGTFLGETDENLVTAKAQLDWQASDSILVYLGYKVRCETNFI